MKNKPMNILIVEDMEPDAVLVKRQVLKALPLAVVTVARNRAEFYSKMEWSVPDLVLSDYNLPDINGLEVLLHIREKKQGLPLVFVTGILNDEEKVAEAILRGASGYVLKENLPSLPDKLADVIKKSEEQLESAQKAERRKREAELTLQKAQAKLGTSADFEGKEEIRQLLAEALDALHG